MREAFGVCLITLCLVFQCSGSPRVTFKRLTQSATRPTEVPVTTEPSVSLLQIFKKDSNSTPKKAAVGNHSSENLFVMLKDRIYSYRNQNKPYDNTAGNRLLTLKDKFHRYIVDTNKTLNTNQSSESPIVKSKDQNQSTTTTPDENQFSKSPFVTFKYEDYHSKSREMPSRRNSTSAMKKLAFFLKQFQQFNFQQAINEYVENNLDF